MNGPGRQVHGFDLDGTLVHSLPGREMKDVDKLRRVTRANREVLGQALTLIEEGHEVHVITGRSMNLVDVTHEQVTQFLGVDFPLDRVHLQPDKHFTSMSTVIMYKTGKMLRLGITDYWGDLVDDYVAAVAAGARFHKVV